MHDGSEFAQNCEEQDYDSTQVSEAAVPAQLDPALQDILQQVEIAEDIVDETLAGLCADQPVASGPFPIPPVDQAPVPDPLSGPFVGMPAISPDVQHTLDFINKGNAEIDAILKLPAEAFPGGGHAPTQPGAFTDDLRTMPDRIHGSVIDGMDQRLENDIKRREEMNIYYEEQEAKAALDRARRIEQDTKDVLNDQPFL